MAHLCAAVLVHAAARAAVLVAGVADVAAVVLPLASRRRCRRRCRRRRQHRRKWWKLENYWGDTKPNSKAGAIDTHKHPLKPKSLPFKLGRAWREIDAFIVSRVAMDSHYTLLQTIMNNTWEVSQVESVWDLNLNCPISTLYVYSRDRQEKPIS